MIHVLFSVKYRYKQRQYMDRQDLMKLIRFYIHFDISHAVLKDVLMGIPKSGLSGDLLGVTVAGIHVEGQQLLAV